MASNEEIKLHNTLGRKVEVFTPINPQEVTMYSCGPTVYARAHIGNLRAYIFADILRRTLELHGYEVKHVMNITDVGHLVSDADTGEDKMQRAAKASGQKSLDIAAKWTELFFQDIDKLHIERAKIICKATEHIKEQIDMVKKLEKKGYTYKTSDGIYFDTSKFPHYADLGRLNIEGLSAGKRIDLGEKRNKTDFALWKLSPKDEQRDLEWDSPWGTGFPGWHIECSAMCIAHLGETVDIHTGGIDHIPVHHTNEIAQAECATGKKFVKYWLHSEFLVMSEEEKMSKSKGNIINLDTLEEQGFDVLAYRYLCLNTHYRRQLIYGKEILASAQNSYDGLKNKIKDLGLSGAPSKKAETLTGKAATLLKEFKGAVYNDLNTPQALAVLWTALRDKDLKDEEKYALACDFDRVLALGISEMALRDENIPEEVAKLADERERHRKAKNWTEADRLRDKIAKKGYAIRDTADGYELEKA